MFNIDLINWKEEINLSEEPLIHENVSLKNCSFGVFTEVKSFSILEDVVLGDFSYICEYCNIYNTEISKFSNIASNVRINPGFHPVELPTLHHFLYRSKKYGFRIRDDEEFFNWRKLQKVYIGHDTWIGHGAVIMPGVRIGNGSVVGSNAVVTEDVPPYTIVAGVPAKFIRKRFNQDIVKAIEKTEWWNWDYLTIKERIEDFKDLRKFLWKYSK